MHIACKLSCFTVANILCRIAPKKISAAGFTTDGQHVMMADKFGDVYIAALLHQGNAPASLEGQLTATSICTHFCGAQNVCLQETTVLHFD